MITTPAGATGILVPANTVLSLWSCRFANVTSSPVTLEVWRITFGGSNVNQYQAVPTITIPPPSFLAPYFDWSPRYQMAAGDAIWAVAGTASALTVTGDGGITTYP